MLLVILFSFMAQSARVEKKIERAYSLIVERQNIQLRLQDLFTSLTREKNLKPLYTKKFSDEKNESLIALFDNGVDPDPAFSGAVLSRIFLDDQKNMCIVLWPLGEEHKEKSARPLRKEILMRNAHSYAFEFLGETQGKDPKVVSITPSVGWHRIWKESRSDVPSMIRLAIETDEGPVRFAFRLPTAEPIATYGASSQAKGVRS